MPCLFGRIFHMVLALTLENVQKRAMTIIFPVHTYQEALASASLATLVDRRSAIGINYIEKLKRPEY